MSERTEPLLLGAVADCARAVGETGSRRSKSELLAGLLAEATPEEAPVVVGLLVGEPRQGRIGVGWATMARVEPSTASEGEGVTVLELDERLDEVAAIGGSGSQERRLERLAELLARMSPDEVEFIRAVLTGGLRQGALAGVMVDGIAKAYSIPATVVRRAAMLHGDLGAVAAIAAESGRAGLEAVGLEVGRGVQPMLASTAESAASAIEELGPSVVQEKLDGIRIQAHRAGEEINLFTRNLNDVTDRLPGVVAVVAALGVQSVVLDGEVVGISEDDAELFQDTASTFSSGGESGRVSLDVQFFDVLHRDGLDLIDDPLEARLASLAEIAEPHLVPGIVTSDPAEAEAFAESSIARGREGVVVKEIGSPYAAGRRGKSWRKVKPVHTYDLVVLGAEWGHGRRTGWLSNLHLGARDGDEFVMVGKTFKGLTDALLEWQTAALLDREDRREGITVFVRPELVVEIALDGVQRSTTYPGGLALRFARVRRYREDKTPQEANTLEDLRELFR